MCCRAHVEESFRVRVPVDHDCVFFRGWYLAQSSKMRPLPDVFHRLST